MDRVRINPGTDGNGKAETPPKKQGRYFREEKPRRFFSSGCKLLDCVLGGGWALGRVGNIVGDLSTGKSLLCIEASANFAAVFPAGKILYREIESAFDPAYAAVLGLPLDRVALNPGKPCFTVEDVFNDMDQFVGACGKAKTPGLYVLDSLDALSDAAELDRGFGEGTYGTGKAKQMSELFRRINQRMAQADITLLIVSQVRDAIGVTFGRKTTRSGGRALDFYASQVLYLAHKGRVKQTRKGVTRPVGDEIIVKCDKNKLAPPHQLCEFPVLYGYGIDDLGAGIAWLKEVNRLDDLALTEDGIKDYRKQLRALTDAEYAGERRRVNRAVGKAWAEIEADFLPKRRKY